MEPPPAATVWMLIIGARMRTPATCVSKARSNSPAKWLTSVDVPPMSKPMTRSKSASCAVRTMPTMPPAGPRQDGVLALEGVRVGEAAGRLHEEQPHARHLAGHLLDIAAQDRRQVGVDHRRVAAAHRASSAG
jgi:hypothetical protein